MVASPSCLAKYAKVIYQRMGMFQSQIELDGHDKLKSFTFSSKAAVCRELKAFMVEFRFDAYGKREPGLLRLHVVSRSALQW